MPRIEPVLAAEGWTDLRDPDEDGGKAFGRDGVRLELTYLYRDDDGGVYTPLLDGTRGRWTAESLADEVGELGGVRCRLVSLASLTRMKSRSRGGADKEARDRADHAALQRLARGSTPPPDPARPSSSR
jgi:hypothetical protein